MWDSWALEGQTPEQMLLLLQLVGHCSLGDAILPRTVYVFSMKQLSETIYCCHLHISLHLCFKRKSQSSIHEGKMWTVMLGRRLRFRHLARRAKSMGELGFQIQLSSMFSIIQHGPALVTLNPNPNSVHNSLWRLQRDFQVARIGDQTPKNLYIYKTNITCIQGICINHRAKPILFR